MKLPCTTQMSVMTGTIFTSIHTDLICKRPDPSSVKRQIVGVEGDKVFVESLSGISVMFFQPRDLQLPYGIYNN